MKRTCGSTLVSAGVETPLTLASGERVVRLMPTATWWAQL
jgi:hypothetical protein